MESENSLSVVEGSHKERNDSPYSITLLDLGGQLPINLSKLTGKLNERQNVFRFEVASLAIKDLGVFDMRRLYSDAHLFSIVKNHIEGISNYGIGITYHILEENSFNRHDVKQGIGVVTIDDTKPFLPPGKTLEQYLTYLLLCEAFCLIGGQDFEHKDRRTFCLFDMCENKEDLRKCLARPCIDDVCKEILRNKGKFSKAQIREAEKLLEYVKKIDRKRAVLQGLEHPISTLVSGGIIGHLIGTLLSHTGGYRLWIPLLFLVSSLGLCIWLLGFPHER